MTSNETNTNYRTENKILYPHLPLSRHSLPFSTILNPLQRNNTLQKVLSSRRVYNSSEKTQILPTSKGEFTRFLDVGPLPRYAIQETKEP